MIENGIELRRITPTQWSLVALIVAIALGSLLYRLLTHQHLEQTAALFLGVPAVLAIAIALQPRTRTATGMIVKCITLALLIAAPMLGEGFFCVLFAAPLFYIVGIAVGQIADRWPRKKGTTLSCTALLLLPMCLEGVVPGLTFPRDQIVTVRRTIPASADAVRRQLALPPNVTTPLPAYLRIGFPRPLRASGNGLQRGSLRTILFSGAEGKPPGDLRMHVVASRPGYVAFAAIDDASKLAHWIAWDTTEVAWAAVDATHTSVTWRIHFTRQLDPAWYFIPLERAAVYEAASYLIEANATPQEAGTR